LRSDAVTAAEPLFMLAAYQPTSTIANRNLDCSAEDLLDATIPFSAFSEQHEEENRAHAHADAGQHRPEHARGIL